jgi:phosphatidylinositol glycan class K
MCTTNAPHSKLYAVIVDTSAFWFNYRHNSNALSIYSLLKSSGVPDDQIILMLADDVACNPRNPHAGRVFNTDNVWSRRNVYGENVEVDFRGSEVTVENFFRLLTDRLPLGTPRSKRLLTDDRSNILLFMTGHGGENFLKFQDSEEINAHDLADAIGQMHERRRFHRMLVMIDTCQADSMFEAIAVPNVVTIASSSRGESSYSVLLTNTSF